MSDLTVETFEVEGLKVRIEYDDMSGSNPRDNDNLGIMVCWHPDYVLGDEQIKNLDGRGAVETEHDRSRRFKSLEHLRRYIGLTGGLCVMPLYLYDHSGISISVGSAGDNPFDRAGWDSSDVGFIYTTEERIAACCGDSPEYRTTAWLEDALRGDVKEYDSYLRGEVYGYVVETADGEHLDSCWGFVGDVKYCIEEARAAAESEVADRKRKADEFNVAHGNAWAREFSRLAPAT